MRKLCAALLVLLVHGAVDARADDAVFTSSVQVRHRFEVDARDFTNGTDPLTFSQLRTRVGLAYEGAENVSAFVQFQDSRLWGEEFSTLLDGAADRFDLHQGYLEVDKFFVDPLKLKLGRTEVNYGSQRLIGAVDWHNIGRAFDGIILTVSTTRFVPDFFYFAQVESLQVGDKGDLAIFGMNADIITSDRYQTQVYAIWQRNAPSSVLSRGTIGFFSKGKMGNFSHEAEAAYQFGTITPNEIYGPFFATDSVKVDVQAFMVTLNLWYHFNTVTAKPGVSLGVDFLSGMKAGEPAGSDFKSFDTLYATNHKFYGFMDFFLNIPVETGGLGLVDLHAKADATFRDNIAKLAFHVFRSHEEFILVDNSTTRSFGSELDATFVHKYSKNLAFVLGASAFWPDDIFKETRGTGTSWWAYVMTRVNV